MSTLTKVMTHPRNWSLKACLTALLVAAFAPLAGLTLFCLVQGTEEERVRQGHELQEMAAVVASQVAERAAAAQERLAVLARLPQVRAANRQEVDKLFQSRPEPILGKPLGPLPGMARGETVVPGTSWHSVVAIPEEMVAAHVRQDFLRVALPAILILLQRRSASW